jgi:tetratricopeptide (TPR) repeat protein
MRSASDTNIRISSLKHLEADLENLTVPDHQKEEVLYHKNYLKLKIALELQGMNKFRDSEYYFSEANKYFDFKSLDLNLNWAHLCLNQGNFARARELIQSSELIRPNFRLVHFLYGLYYLRQKDWKNASEQYKKTYELSQSINFKSQASWFVGFCLFKQKHFNEAKVYLQLVHCCRFFEKDLFDIIQILNQLKLYKKAIEFSEELRKMYPKIYNSWKFGLKVRLA